MYGKNDRIDEQEKINNIQSPPKTRRDLKVLTT